MKVVVPTDFSGCSKIAVRFAVGFARQLQAELTLLHVLPHLGPTVGRLPSGHFKQQLLEWTKKQFDALEAELKAEDLLLSFQVAYGAGVEKALGPFIQGHAIDLVIMGTKGATGLKKVLMGSNTVDVLNHCSVPVVVVPEHATFTPITHLIYASDLKHLSAQVETLVPFARLLHATIKIIHIPPVEYREHLDTERLLQTLKKESGYQSIELELLEGKDIASTIEQYVVTTRGEILVMFTHHPSFLEQIFRHSLTREIAWQNKVPLLVINNP